MLMSNQKIIILLAIALLLSWGCPAFSVGATPVPSETIMPENIPQDIFPLNKTEVILLTENITLDWAEKDTHVKAMYRLSNPQSSNIKLKIGLDLPAPPEDEPSSSTENSAERPAENPAAFENPENPPATITTKTAPLLQVYHQGVEINTTYSKKHQAYIWELELAAEAETTFTVNYTVINESNNQGLTATGFCFPPANRNIWAGELPAFSLVLNFQNTHPGQISQITPRSYRFENDALVWSWNPQEERENVLITANLQEELNSIFELLSVQEKSQLQNLLSQEQYYQASTFLEEKADNLPKNEEKQLLQLGQAYFLGKANQTKKALNIMSDLVDHDTSSSRAYWELGKSYYNRTSKLGDLLAQIQELKIHPLLQTWLITKIPPEDLELTVPEITTLYADTNNSRKGLLFKSHITDSGGDLARIILRYHWENETINEVSFKIKPFQYDYDLFYFTLAPGSFKRLYYEIEITDFAGNKISSGQKETFYLNKAIQSEAFILNGANLILGDYPPEEQAKIHKWFKSYLQITKEVGFVPVDTKSPLIVFLGKEHDFIKKFEDALFICHTPIPFSPDHTRIQVHRYFLSYWYGAGWDTLPEEEVLTLGDALMLGKGWSAKTLKHLQTTDEQLFAKFLCQIGEGKGWKEALMSTYGLTPIILDFLTVWDFIGSYVISVTIIIAFAWLGKNGYITRIISLIKATK